MARKAVFSPSPPPPPPKPKKKSPPLTLKDPTRKTRARCAELAGATTAECTAVVCCGPCTVIDILVLTTVKVPAGLCKKAMRKRRAKVVAKKKVRITIKTSTKKNNNFGFATDDDESSGKDTAAAAAEWLSNNLPTEEEKKMEEEMWDKFCGAGFWRSPSQKEPTSLIPGLSCS